MNRQEAIDSITPDKCPACGSTKFAVVPENHVKTSNPPWYGLHLECVTCEWKSLTEWYRKESIAPEYVYTEMPPSEELRKALKERFPDVDTDLDEPVDLELEEWWQRFDGTAYENSVINAFDGLSGVSPLTEAAYHQSMIADE